MKYLKNLIFILSLLFCALCFYLYIAPLLINKYHLKTISDFDRNFNKPIISSFSSLKYPPVKNKEDLNKRINKFKIDIDSIEFAYSSIKILSSNVNNDIVEISFIYKNKKDTVYAYLKEFNGNYNNIGSLIIPGSGLNQSSQIFYKNDKDENYQSNIDDILNEYGDTYILVKPNEDFLAIHNGKKKIDEVSYVNHLINSGSSYSRPITL